MALGRIMGVLKAVKTMQTPCVRQKGIGQGMEMLGENEHVQKEGRYSLS